MVLVAGKAGLIGEVLQPVDEVLARADVERVDVGRVRHNRVWERVADGTLSLEALKRLGAVLSEPT